MMATAARPETEPKEDWIFTWKPHVGANHCSRCGGLMVMEQLMDLPARRCVQCGEIVDPVILHNRRLGSTIGMN